MATGSSVTLYQDVTSFTPELNPDFGRASFPAYMVDPGIVSASLHGSAVPKYARESGYTRTTSGAQSGTCHHDPRKQSDSDHNPRCWPKTNMKTCVI